MSSVKSNTYNLNFRACSLRPDLARIVAECYLEEGNWDSVKERILVTNALQTRSEKTAVRLEREMRQRLSTLSQRQLEILAHAPTEDRAAITWLAVCKRIAFVRDFAIEVLAEKLEAHDHTLRPSDYEKFIDTKSLTHPELTSMNETTSNKVRQITLRMIKEAGILSKGESMGRLSRPVLSLDVRHAIKDDNVRWLAVFLVPPTEIDAA